MTNKINRKKIIGHTGEVLAKNFLIKKGYEILFTNYRTKIGEIDIIALENNELVFIEVKTRTNKNFLASEAITYKKQKTIANVGEIFLEETSPKYDNIIKRFDLVLIDEWNISLIKNAFFV